MTRWLVATILIMAALTSQASEQQTYTLTGLEKDAEILIDEWGVPHIYAQAHYDAFFVQGFNAARDRLWQIDLWRRRGLGELSSILGANFIEQDKAARLFIYRGDMFREWLAYGSDAKKIAESFTRGINAYIKLTRVQADLLPEEFKRLDYTPALWKPEDPVLIRSNGLWRNIINEVKRANTICKHSLEIDAKRRKLEPNWTTKVPDGLDPCSIPADVTKLYALAKAPVDFSRAVQAGALATLSPDYEAAMAMLADITIDAGSNNWALAPHKTSTGRALLANDPHRGHAVPSLRYIAHLVAPGLNVIGAGEPALPGISIGHNERIAFGLTIFSADQEDLIVYKTWGKKYRYKNSWHKMKVVNETIEVRGEKSRDIELLFTRDGPVIYRDKQNRFAYAVRAAWLEPGMAPYFGSIEYMRAQNWHQFLAALNRWGAPSENQVYADVDGNIGYKPAGLTPIRHNYDGLLPVPGDGRYEWHGFYDMDQLPVQYNPSSGFVATANAMSLPADYPYQEKLIGFEWAEPWRIQRIREVLAKKEAHDFKDSVQLQRDYLSIPARKILSSLDVTQLPEPSRQLFSGWDYILGKDSAAAALFEFWQSQYLMPALISSSTGLTDISSLGRLDKQVAIEHLLNLPGKQRQILASETLRAAVIDLTDTLGPDVTGWRWGDLHKMKFKHPLFDLLDVDDRSRFAIQEVARGGSGDTVNSTRYRSDFSVASGGSWRMVIDVGNWDAAVMTNAPGQSGLATSPHYDDMLQTWADDGVMPLLYSRDKILEHTVTTITLKADKSPSVIR